MVTNFKTVGSGESQAFKDRWPHHGDSTHHGKTGDLTMETVLTISKTDDLTMETALTTDKTGDLTMETALTTGKTGDLTMETALTIGKTGDLTVKTPLTTSSAAPTQVNWLACVTFLEAKTNKREHYSKQPKENKY